MATATVLSTFAAGATKSGQVGNVGYAVVDTAGTVRIARTTAGITEETDAAGNAATGLYYAYPAIDPTWGPVRVKWSITGMAGVAGDDVIGNGEAIAQLLPVSAVTGSVGGSLTGVAGASAPAWYAAPTAPPTSSQIATAVWQDTAAGDFTVAGSPGIKLGAPVNVGSVSGVAVPAGTGFPKVDGSNLVTANSVTGNVAGSLTGVAGASAPSWYSAGGGGGGPTAAQIATAVWQDTTAGDFAVAGSSGIKLGNLDAAVSSRLAASAYTAPANPADYARNNVAPSWYSAGGGGGSAQLPANGLDNVVIEAGINARQALSVMLAYAAGGLTGVSTGNPVFKGANGATTRISATTGPDGRPSVTLNLPT